ncbi:MAG: hypothetical protein WA432_00335 [Candidatus Babeliaceae bacterium]
MKKLLIGILFLNCGFTYIQAIKKEVLSLEGCCLKYIATNEKDFKEKHLVQLSAELQEKIAQIKYVKDIKTFDNPFNTESNFAIFKVRLLLHDRAMLLVYLSVLPENKQELLLQKLQKFENNRNTLCWEPTFDHACETSQTYLNEKIKEIQDNKEAQKTAIPQSYRMGTPCCSRFPRNEYDSGIQKMIRYYVLPICDMP